MIAPPEPIALRKTVIGGETAPDDYVVIWDGLPIGRIMRQPSVPTGNPNWSWGIILHVKPQTNAMRGTSHDLEECQRRFKEAWLDTYRSLTDADVEMLRHLERRNDF